MQKKSVREIEIPVSWGKLAGKLWGDDNQQPILALHGWQDNAGSFNKLAPLLENCSILAIDWPGHGNSSWLPPGTPYNEFNYLFVINQIKRHFGWEHLKLMGHSLGGMVSFTYAALFNTEIQFIIGIDVIKFPTYETNSYNSLISMEFLTFVELENLPASSVPSYSEEEMINRWIKATDEGIDEQGCKELIIRGTRRNTDGTLSVCRDPRLKIIPVTLFGYNQKTYKALAMNIKNPYLTIKARDAPYLEDKQNVVEVANIINENSSDFSYHEVPGRHYLHLTNPCGVAEVINPFLQKYNN